MSDLKFEDALTNLEEIVNHMEAGDLSLDESLKKYEEGIKLIRLCNKKLAVAEKKIEILVNADDESLAKINFDDYDPQQTPNPEKTKSIKKTNQENKKIKEAKEATKEEVKEEGEEEKLPPREEGMLF